MPCCRAVCFWISGVSAAISCPFVQISCNAIAGQFTRKHNFSCGNAYAWFIVGELCFSTGIPVAPCAGNIHSGSVNAIFVADMENKFKIYALNGQCSFQSPLTLCDFATIENKKRKAIKPNAVLFIKVNGFKIDKTFDNYCIKQISVKIVWKVIDNW